MLLWIIGLVGLIGGIIMIVIANKKKDSDDQSETLRKVGIVLLFIGFLVLSFVIAMNIMVLTGRVGVIN